MKPSSSPTLSLLQLKRVFLQPLTGIFQWGVGTYYFLQYPQHSPLFLVLAASLFLSFWILWERALLPALILPYIIPLATFVTDPRVPTFWDLLALLGMSLCSFWMKGIFEQAVEKEVSLSQEAEQLLLEKEQFFIAKENAWNLQKALLEEKITHLQQLEKSAPSPADPVVRDDGSTAMIGKHHYDQLRKQFQDKNEILRQTREQLFKLEGQLHATKVEATETHFQNASTLYRSYREENLRLEEEKQILEQLVTKLLNESKEADPRDKMQRE